MASKAEISKVMKHLSSLGAAKGGEARAKKLSAKRRKEIAMMGVKARADKRLATTTKPADER